MGLNRTLATLEPAWKCAGRCTFCHVQIPRRAAGGERECDDPGTFESLVEKAFGPSYDPTNLLQFGLREKIPFVWSAGVEPFQDISVAKSILSILRSLKIPVFIQTRSTNWREVWDDIVPLAGDVGFYVSIPSLNPAYIKRFEPKTPPIEERIALVRAAAAAGIPSMVAVAPYHPEWCPDLPGLAREAHSWGATDFFLDVLHLNRRQVESIETTGGDRALIPLAKTAWTEHSAAQWAEAAEACADLEMGFETVAHDALVHEIFSFPSPDPWPFRTARRWPYVESAYMADLQDLYDDEPDGPILLEWPQALAAMEAGGQGVDQPFSMASVGQLIAVKDLPDAWRRSLGKAAPMREYLRAIWNNPKANGFPWHHPFVRYAVDPKGVPLRGEGGDLVMAYDPMWGGKALARPFESTDDLRRLAYD